MENNQDNIKFFKMTKDNNLSKSIRSTEYLTMSLFFFIIWIMVFMNASLITDSLLLKGCDYCEITYKTKLPGQPGTLFQKQVTVNATTLFDYYIHDQCLIKWDKHVGFIYDG